MDYFRQYMILRWCLLLSAFLYSHAEPLLVDSRRNRVLLRNDFDYRFARNVFDFAAASYAPNPWGCAERQNTTVAYRIALPCDYMKNECWAIIAVSPSLVVVSFRGTQTKLQLIMELLQTMTEPKKKLRAGGSVQHYFYVALEAIWKPINDALVREKKANPARRFVFTGHSLGGAIASLASTIFAHRHPGLRDRIYLITYGQPRVGNQEYAEAHDRLVLNSWRLIHRYDLVAHIPYCYERLWSHECSPLYNHGPYHHGTEVWFPGNMTLTDEYRMCTGSPRGEDSKCSNAWYLHYNIGDHLLYFNENVSLYGEMGCAPDPTGEEEEEKGEKEERELPFELRYQAGARKVPGTVID